MTSSQRCVRAPLPADPRAAALARRLVDQLCRGTEDDVRDAVLLLTSEVVTNAVRHTSTHPVLRACLLPGAVRVEVADGSDSAPSLSPGSPGVDAESGRGLMLVDGFASRWGVTPGDVTPGKVVWFEVAVAS